MRTGTTLRRVPASVRVADFFASAVLRVGGWLAPLVLASSALWLVVQAARGSGAMDWGRVAGWVAGSMILGTCGVVLALPAAFAGTLLSRPVRLGAFARSTAALPLCVPAFVILHQLAPLVSQATGVPAQHPIWAVIALGWGMAMPLWLSLSDAMERKNIPRWTEGALALGAHPSQILTSISIPAARAGLFASLLRAVARASGETMAVLLVSGNFSSFLGGADGSASAGVALVLDMPEAIHGGDLWRDLMRGALLLSLWAMVLHGIAQRLDPRWVEMEPE